MMYDIALLNKRFEKKVSKAESLNKRVILAYRLIPRAFRVLTPPYIGVGITVDNDKDANNVFRVRLLRMLGFKIEE